MRDELILDAVQQLLRSHCTPRHVRALESGGSHQELWRELEASGFPNAMVPEAQGGAGLGLAHVFPIWTLCGAFLLPVPLAQTMVARALLAGTSVDGRVGSIALADGRLDASGGVRCAAVVHGRVADTVLVQHVGGWQLLRRGCAHSTPSSFCLDADLYWPPAQVLAAPQLSILLPQDLKVRTLLACLVAAQLAGALMEVVERTRNYANDRHQFGRPIGSFQAVQHHLAVMSEHAFAAQMAAQLGCAGEGALPNLLRVAVAKARCSQAAQVLAELGHAIHGAIGFTEEYDLQLYTRRLHSWRQAAGSESYWHGVAGIALLDMEEGSTLDLLRAITDVDF